MALTTDDRLDIYELNAKYADALDFLEPELLRDVFTDDAVWEVAERGFRLVGLPEIMAFMGRSDVHPGAHLITNAYVQRVTDDPDGDGSLVTLRSRGIYPVGPSTRSDPTGVFYGRYEDDVVKTSDGWRIRHRRFVFGV